MLAILFVWRRVTEEIEFENIATRTDETFYRITILAPNTLGTALGDFVADDAGLGFQRGALLFTGMIVLVTLAYFFTKIPRAVLLGAAYILTRPLGATLGDRLTKPYAAGGFDLSRIASSLVLGIIWVARREQHRASRAVVALPQ